MKSFYEMDPLERLRYSGMVAMEPWKEEFQSLAKMRLVIPIKLPSTNSVQGSAFGKKSLYANMAKKKKDVKAWKDAVETVVRSQAPPHQVKLFKDRLGMDGVCYRITIIARLFRLYDDDNCFLKYLIDALKGLLIKDDSKKYIVSCDVEQEIIPYAKRKSEPYFGRGKRKTITKYYDSTGKQLFPETIIEIELVERNPVLL